MKRLWAPWRMQYIGVEQRPGCLFCRVIEHPDDPDAELVVWRPKGAIVMLNKFPYNPGHALVAPIKHTSTLEELDDDEGRDLFRALRRTLQVLRTTMRPEGPRRGWARARGATSPAGATWSRPPGRRAGPRSRRARRTRTRASRPRARGRARRRRAA